MFTRRKEAGVAPSPPDITPQVADKTTPVLILIHARAGYRTTAVEREEPTQSREIQKVGTTTETTLPKVQVKR